MSGFYASGNYRLRVIGAALGEAGNGTPQVEIGVEILGYYDQAEGFVAETGPERTVYIALTEGTLGTPQNPGWAWLTLADLGFVGPSFNDLSPLIGQIRDGQCKQEDWQGSTVERWSLFRRRAGNAQRPIEDKKARALNAKFAGLLRGAKPAANAAPAPIGSPDKHERIDQAVMREAAAGQAYDDHMDETRAAVPMPRKSKKQKMAEGMKAPAPGTGKDNTPF